MTAFNPMAIFAEWFAQAQNTNIKEPEAMTLVTVSAEGKPSARMVLMKYFDEEGFIFFSNYISRKGQELAINPHVALVFWWPSIERQVRIEGCAEKVSTEKSDAYFNTRPRDSRIGAWASAQSKIIPDRLYLEKRVEYYSQQFNDKPIERPDYWGGYCVKPTVIEFWQGKPNRLHERTVYSRQEDNSWQMHYLSP